jgi:hypothetical protein
LQREFSVLAETDVNTVEQFSQLIVRQQEGLLIRLVMLRV